MLTAVGLLAMAVAGVDIDRVMQGAAEAMKLFAEPDMEKNICYQYAALRYLFYKQGKSIDCFRLFAPKHRFKEITSAVLNELPDGMQVGREICRNRAPQLNKRQTQ